jgi:hypothetical protein
MGRRPLSIRDEQQRAGLLARKFRHRLYEVASYRYSFASSRGPTEKLRALAASAWRVSHGKRILFFPEEPWPKTLLFKVSLYAGHRVVLDPTERHDAAIKWWDDTFTPNTKLSPQFLAADRIINLACEDISKSRVDRVFAEVFGYTIVLDPTRHRGPCVEKSDLNAAHDGQIVECPIEAPRHGRVYQKLIDNSIKPGTVEDIRVPVFGDSIPFVYVRTRPIDIRFGAASATARIVETDVAFSGNEIARILEFTHSMGFECGDLDVIRDQADGRMYIVDANTTPFAGSLNRLSPRDAARALDRSNRSFEALLARRGAGY